MCVFCKHDTQDDEEKEGEVEGKDKDMRMVMALDHELGKLEYVNLPESKETTRLRQGSTTRRPAL